MNALKSSISFIKVIRDYLIFIGIIAVIVVPVWAICVNGQCGGGGGGTPGGSNTQLQYNNSSAFGGTAGLTWSSANSQLLIPDGVAANPAIAFGSDTNLGIFNDTFGSMVFTNNSTTILTVSIGSVTVQNADFRIFGTGTFTTPGKVVDNSFDIQTPSTGFSISIAETVHSQIIDPSGTLATGTFVLPPNPTNGEYVRIKSTQVVTALTISGTGGASVKGAPATIPLGGLIDCQYQSSNTTWYC